MISPLDIELMQKGTTFLEKLKGKRILISGATGFVGKWLLECFIASGVKAEVFVITRKAGLPYKNVSYLVGNINYDLSAWDYTAPNFDYAIHAAPIPAYSFIGFCKRHQVKRFMYLSSGEMYHNRERYAAYRLMKQDDERMIVTCGLDAVNCRLFSFAGPYLPDKFAISQFINQAITERRVTVQNGQNIVRSYLYGADLAMWLWKILLLGDDPIYDIGGKIPITIHELAWIVAGECGADFLEVEGPQIHERYVPEDFTGVDALGLTENYNINEMIQRTIEWKKREHEAI